ncbi:hypothetical protein [Streptosporangium sp. NPDC001681]|uniref:hypothetical protein n=1 Tax=Streptosporangium sp. NPDC001681 TaxID=3154395 RepID=UPI00331B3ABC
MTTLVLTRQSLHGVAELVLAGPQYRQSGTIRLRAVPGGFATTKHPDVAVNGDLLLTSGRPLRKLTGVTYAELAAAAGIVAGAPEGLYSEGSGVTAGDRVHVDPQAAMVIARALGDGDAALRRLAPGMTPVLWPEHFDIGVTLDEVNYGVSPGDRHIPEPYAYVGPGQPRTGQFWNTSFGAARPLTQLPHAEAIYEFFDEGRRRAHGEEP